MDLPNYYSVIPASVRYDDSLSSGAKLLYGEITALSNKTGHCWAKNAYFTNLYNCDERTIRRWLSELEAKGHISVDLSSGGRQICPPPRTKMSAEGDKNVRPNVKKTENGGSTQPQKEEEAPPNSIINTTESSPADDLSFEDWMESQGYRHDSLVGSEGQASVWWEDENGRKLKASEVRSLKVKWRPAPPRPIDTAVADTERLVDLIKRSLEDQYGTAPVIGNEAKAMLRQNLVRRFDKDFLKRYAQWYFVDSSIDKKWRFSIPSFTSERFINQFLSEQ